MFLWNTAVMVLCHCIQGRPDQHWYFSRCRDIVPFVWCSRSSPIEHWSVVVPGIVVTPWTSVDLVWVSYKIYTAVPKASMKDPSDTAWQVPWLMAWYALLHLLLWVYRYQKFMVHQVGWNVPMKIFQFPIILLHNVGSQKSTKLFSIQQARAHKRIFERQCL